MEPLEKLTFENRSFPLTDFRLSEPNNWHFLCISLDCILKTSFMCENYDSSAYCLQGSSFSVRKHKQINIVILPTD